MSLVNLNSVDRAIDTDTGDTYPIVDGTPVMDESGKVNITSGSLASDEWVDTLSREDLRTVIEAYNAADTLGNGTVSEYWRHQGQIFNSPF